MWSFEVCKFNGIAGRVEGRLSEQALSFADALPVLGRFFEN